MCDGVGACRSVSKGVARVTAICAANTGTGNIFDGPDPCDRTLVGTVRAPRVCAPLPDRKQGPRFSIVHAPLDPYAQNWLSQKRPVAPHDCKAVTPDSQGSLPMPSDVAPSSTSQQPRAAGLETALLTEAGARWLQEHGLPLIGGFWLLARLWTLWGLQPSSDVVANFETASRMLDGSSPYGDLASHDSPGALVLLLLPRLVAASPLTYGYVLAALLLAADLAILGMLWRIPGTIFGRAVTWDSARRYETVTMSVTYIALTATAGSLAFQRPDLLVGAILLVLFYGVLQRCRSNCVDILLAMCVWIQPNVLMLVLLIWIHGFVAERKAGTGATCLPLSR
jgi:hypothetical protein